MRTKRAYGNFLDNLALVGDEICGGFAPTWQWTNPHPYDWAVQGV